MRYEWSDKLGHRSRHAWLLLVNNDKVTVFKGTVPGLVVVVGTTCHTNGKWSETIYRLELAESVRPISGRDGWETGTFAEGLRQVAASPPIDFWVDLANALGVSLTSAQEFLRGWRPKAAEKFDEVESALIELEKSEIEAGGDILAVSFGSPTKRQMNEGFWDKPVKISVEGVTVGTVEKDPEHGWSKPSCYGPILVISATHSSGYHGGYVSLRLSVPVGASWER